MSVRTDRLRALLPITFVCALTAAVACGSSSDTPTPAAVDQDAGETRLPDGAVKPGTDGAAVTPDGSQPSAGIKTVFVVVMENHSWATIKGAGASATYINGTLVPMGAHAEAYAAPVGNHPSEPNYIWLEAGDNLGITNDNPPSANHQATKDHLTAQLESKKITWKAYAEDAPAGTCPRPGNKSAREAESGNRSIQAHRACGGERIPKRLAVPVQGRFGDEPHRLHLRRQRQCQGRCRFAEMDRARG